MESTVVRTSDSSTDKYFYLKWINSLLKTNFKNVEEMGSGDSSV